MKTIFSARKINLSDSFKELVDKRLLKLGRFFDEETTANVVAAAEKSGVKVEVTIRAKGMVFRAERSAKDKADAFESAVESLTKQIVKNKDRLVTRLKTGAFGGLPETEMHEAFDIIKTKTFSAKLMNVEEAILQMELIGHAFFIFNNEASGEINVVYKRKDEGYGLLVPSL